jgi:hypothetical protein
MTAEPVGGLAVDGTEVRFAIDDCGCNSFLFTARSLLAAALRSGLEGFDDVESRDLESGTVDSVTP